MTQPELELLPGKHRIPDGARFLYKQSWGDTTDYFFLLSEKNTEKMVIRTILDFRTIGMCGGSVVHIMTERNQKFCCVNGPHAGQNMTEPEGKIYGYKRFNCADNARRSKGWPRNVLVHSVFMTPTGMVQFDISPKQ
jgi:hypothetical protein